MSETVIDAPVEVNDQKIENLLAQRQQLLRDATASAERINAVAPVLAQLEKLKQDDEAVRRNHRETMRQFEQIDYAVRLRILKSQIGGLVEVSSEFCTGTLLEVWCDKALVQPEDACQVTCNLDDLYPLGDERYCPSAFPPAIKTSPNIDDNGDMPF